ncbi:AAA family ATPase [Agrococcus jejuensis]|uniref:AAA domain-containing protein n=1 Tax=Agrococcus jejuensis TaxID=399736 RepID=A0A1G8GZ08_9MICO|nr:AAA family ATPase [Agrococcus jejuensis]SDH99574.1 AAA domain-containing protein [Agrococcus jejuensis]
MTTTRGTLLLLAGYPGTGKSVLGAAVERRVPGIVTVALDDAKLARYERYGFADAAEKAEHERRALDDWLAALDATMATGVPVLSDYPFSDKQRPQLVDLCARHGYDPCTVRLVAEFDVLFDRQRARDLDPSRHPSFVLDTYSAGDDVLDRASAPGILTRQEFRRRYDERGYGTFELGPTLEVDTTDFATVDTEAIVDWIVARMRRDATTTAREGRA